MASITSTGVGSGLDVNSIVSGLMTLEKRPLQQLQTQASSYQTRLSAFGSLQGQLTNLGDIAARLATPTSWTAMQADSSDAASASVAARAGATAGVHSLEVAQLAQSQVLASGNYASSAAVVGTGTLTLEIGTTSGGAFTPKSGSTPVSIPIDSSKQTLAGIRDAINAAKAGVTASVVNGSGGSRLVLRGADGAQSSIRLTVADDDGNAADTAGLSALAWDPAAGAGAGRNLTQSQAAQDARFTLNGVEVTSATNTPTDVMDGVDLTLRKVTTAPVTVTVSTPQATLKKNVSDFVGAYNALNSLLRGQTQADPSGKNRGPLQADSTALGVLNGMRELLRGEVGGTAGLASLSAAGVAIQQDGSLKIDDAKLAKALEQPDRVARLFTQAQSDSDASTRGIGVRFSAWAKQLTGTDGSLTSRVDGIKRSVEQNSKQQDVVQDRIDRTEARLRAQYQRLDTQMNDLNARMRQMKSALGLA